MSCSAVIISPEKMRAWMKKNHFSSRYISEKIGRSNNYINTVLTTKRISAASLAFMKEVFGVDESEFKAEEEKPNEKSVGWSTS